MVFIFFPRRRCLDDVYRTILKMDMKSVWMNISVNRTNVKNQFFTAPPPPPSSSHLFASWTIDHQLIISFLLAYPIHQHTHTKSNYQTMKIARRWWSYNAIQLSIEQSIVHDHQRWRRRQRQRSLCHPSYHNYTF